MAPGSVTEADVRSGAVAAAESAVGDLIYTVVFDYVNELISREEVDADRALTIANAVMAKYAEGVKIRKKPAPRAAKAPAKKQVDVLTAAGRKLNNLGRKIVWMYYPDNHEYSYGSNIVLVNGHPVRNNTTQDIEAVINEQETMRLTEDDVRAAVALGLPVASEYFS
jgi:hypothetical protein